MKVAFLLYISGMLAAMVCETLDSRIVLQDMPAERIVRIRNVSDRAIELTYPAADSMYGRYKMFFVRFRDSNGAMVQPNGSPNGWWTPGHMSSTIEANPKMDRLVVPAHGVVDVERDIPALAYGLNLWPETVKGPCQLQIMLVGYESGDRSKQVRAVTEWQPGPCPNPDEMDRARSG